MLLVKPQNLQNIRIQIIKLIITTLKRIAKRQELRPQNIKGKLKNADSVQALRTKQLAVKNLKHMIRERLDADNKDIVFTV